MKARTSALQVKFFSCWSNRIQSYLYVCSASLKRVCFCFFFKVYIDHLFDNLESGKSNYFFGKSLEKVLNFLDPKICMNPVKGLTICILLTVLVISYATGACYIW